MNELLKRYGGRIFFAPPDDKGGNNGGSDDDKGGSGDDQGKGGSGSDDKGGSDRGGGQDNGSSDQGKSRFAGGLFGQRKDNSGGADGGDDKAGSDNGNGDDGKPAKLPEKFLNKDGTPNVDAISKAYTDLERAHGELKRSKTVGGGELPKSADDYFAEGVTVPKEADRFTGLTTDDPGVKTWAEVCHEEGIGKDLASRLMSKMLVKMNEHAPAPIDPELEMKALGPGGEQLVEGLFVWCEGKAATGELSEDDAEVIEQMMMTAKGARLLAKFRNMTGEKPIPITPGSGSRGMSREQWQDEYKKAVAAKDYNRQEELDRLGETINAE